MVNWVSVDEITKDASTVQPISHTYSVLTSFTEAFDRFMHALLGVYMYGCHAIIVYRWIDAHIVGNGSSPSNSTGIIYLEKENSDGQWYIYLFPL